MYVTECSIGMEKMTPEFARDEMMRYRNEDTQCNSISQLRSIAGLCNSGEFDAATSSLPLHERKINGDATDQAVLRFSESLGPVSELRQMWKKTFELAFNSKNKYMIRTLKLVQKEGLDFALPSTEATSFRPDDT
jgi:sodium/potassium-transporting ATPase subunit alpha